ncbi:MAG: hypothetical protein ACRDV1_06335 [Actinomycetes bacterium]
MPSSVARLVAQDHDRLSRLLRRMCSAGPNQERWRTEFLGLLRAHRAAERDELLTDVVSRGGDVTDLARAQAERDLELDRLATEVERVEIESPPFAETCTRAATALRGHADSMAGVLLPALVATAPRRELRRLGGAYEQRRDATLRDMDGHEPPPRRLDLSRAELYELARRAGVQGRSAMSRGQLIRALKRRSD